jgi:hypothetical protein
MLSLLLILINLTINSAKADNTDNSANYYLPGCRAFADKHFADQPFLQGECVGSSRAWQCWLPTWVLGL